MEPQSRPRLVMSSFSSAAELGAALEGLGRHGIDTADILVLTRVQDGYLPYDGARQFAGKLAGGADGNFDPAGISGPLGWSNSLFAEELAAQKASHVLFLAIRHRDQEQCVCRILLEHASAAVLIRDVPRGRDSKE
ncbi:MAG: hypothetical protein KDJ46_07485 [Rhodobiaceae bacterium]|nr:hypothetical protein [Rhodobiaceae bacterium]